MIPELGQENNTFLFCCRNEAIGFILAYNRGHNSSPQRIILLRLGISERLFFRCVRRTLVDQGNANRVPIADAFANRYQIGFDTIMLVSKPFAGPTDTGCHFVGDNVAALVSNDVDDVLNQPFGGKPNKTRCASRLEYKFR
jgi:hypothetical protein